MAGMRASQRPHRLLSRRMAVALLIGLLAALSPAPGLPPGAQAGQLMLSKSLPHYARDMEFYYQRPRPEVLPGLLDALARSGALGHAEKRLMTAAFLAGVLDASTADAAPLAQTLADRAVRLEGAHGRDARHCLAWAIHLARLPDEAALLGRLLGPQDMALKTQICRSPAPLQAWNPESEPAVPRMYWGAFMATGNTALLDALINDALRYGRLNAAGRQADPSFAACASAAALLYDMAPRHEAVRERVAQRLAATDGPEARTLRQILHQ